LVWCHAASVGESLAALPLIKRLVSDGRTSVLITTGTRSSAEVLADRLPAAALHQYAPWDHWAWINRFLDYWRPDLAIRVESEIWPNTLLALDQRAIPAVVVNGRLSNSSLNLWQRFPSTAGTLFGTLRLALSQTQEFANGFQSLGTPVAIPAPNLKLSAQPLPVNSTDLKTLRTQISDRPVWLAASTHDGEEEIALSVHRAVRQSLPGLLTIIVPRHPTRRSEIAGLFHRQDLGLAWRSSGDPIMPETDIYIADTFGELGLFFNLSSVVFMGKSLTAQGGQNPVEAAHFDCAILFGKHMSNFEDIAKIMVEGGMAEQVANREDLQRAVILLLSEDKKREELASSARELVTLGNNSVNKTFAAIQPLLDESM